MFCYQNRLRAPNSLEYAKVHSFPSGEILIISLFYITILIKMVCSNCLLEKVSYALVPDC